MGIFSTPPKRVTEREMKGTPFHSGSLAGIKGNFDSAKIPARNYPVFESIVNAAMNDQDHYKGKNYNGITQEKVEVIKQQMRETEHFSEKQIANVEKHLLKDI